MNIDQAIKSGKAFRRPGRDWIEINRDEGYHVLALSIGDLVADDWEVLEPKKEPKEYWLGDNSFFVYESKEMAKKYCKNVFRVREVLE